MSNLNPATRMYLTEEKKQELRDSFERISTLTRVYINEVGGHFWSEGHAKQEGVPFESYGREEVLASQDEEPSHQDEEPAIKSKAKGGKGGTE